MRNPKDTTILTLYFSVIAIAAISLVMYHAGRYTMKQDIRARITAQGSTPLSIIKIPEIDITLVPFKKGFIVDKQTNVVIAGEIK